MDKSFPYIVRKPSFLSPCILHLYQQYGCINEVEEDALTIAEDEVVYKLGPEVKIRGAGTKESLEDLVVPEPPPFASVPKTRRAATPQPRQEVGPNREQPSKDIDLSNFELPKIAFQRVRAELTHM